VFILFHVRCIFLHPVTSYNIKQSKGTFIFYYLHLFGIWFLTFTYSTKTEKW